MSEEKEGCGYSDKDLNYTKILVSYRGNIEEEVDKFPNICVDIINNFLATIYIERAEVEKFISQSNTIVYYQFDGLYVLEDISPISTAFIPQVQSGDYLKLSGEGVTVAIIDTGIDYLNEAFMDGNGETRIEYIYDRSLKVEDDSKGNSYNRSRFYTEEEINKAIKSYRDGGDPYSIVPSIDKNGHGTNMAGIIGARYKKAGIQSVAPNCKFIIVKLDENEGAEFYFDTKEPIYSESEILNAIEFLINIKIKYNNPTTIFIPLGSTSGGHTGNTLLEVYIDKISVELGFLIVTGTGNEAMHDGHVSGKIEQVDEVKFIELIVGEGEKNIYINVFTKKPNKVSINIISPAGEETGLLPLRVNELQKSRFIFENTDVGVTYYWPDEYSGDEVILIQLENVKPGLWSIELVGEYILNGEYNAWLPPKKVLKEGTRFLGANQYLTMTTPGMSKNIITSAWYNQINNTISIASGRGEDGVRYGVMNAIIPLIAVGGISIETIGLNNKYDIVNGSSSAAAITAGSCALLLEWGIVKGNDKNMNSEKVKTYFMRGVSKRPGDIYPNPEWGYGKLDMAKLFQNIY